MHLIEPKQAGEKLILITITVRAHISHEDTQH